MHNSPQVNATHCPIVASSSSTPPLQTRLSAQVSTAHQGHQDLKRPEDHVGCGAGIASAVKGGLVFPAYWGGLVETPWDVIKDQGSFNEACASVEQHLRTQWLSEEEFLYALESGFFQRPMGKLLADLFIEAVMRSIRPVGDWAPVQLREVVETVCKLPPDEWANVLGERLNFPRGTASNTVAGFIQAQLTLSRLQRDESIANDELLPDAQWHCLQKVVKDCRSSIRPWVEGRLNSTLMKLEDCAQVRRSPRETKFLLGEFLQRLNEPRRERFPDRHKHAVEELLQAIKLDPAPSLLEHIKEWTDPAWVHTGVQRVVNHANSALNSLGALTANDLGRALYRGASAAVSPVMGAVSMAGFGLGAATSPSGNVAEQVAGETLEAGSESDFSLMQTLEEIERKSDPYEHVKISGPRRPDGLAASLLYVGYIAHEAANAVSGLRPSRSIQPGSPQTPPSALEPQPAHSCENLFEQLEWLLLQIDRMFTQATRVATGWNPAAANRLEGLPAINEIKQKLSDANVRVPFAATPTSSYGAAGNPYQNTVETVEPDTSHELGAALAQWLQSAAAYLVAGGGTTFNAATAVARQHPRTTATLALAAIYAAVNELHRRWFADSAPEEDWHYVKEADPALRQYISNDVSSILGEMPQLRQAIKARLDASSHADLHQDPQLVPDIKLLLSKPVLSESDQTVAELIDESVFQSRHRYAHLRISKMEIDEDGNQVIAVDDVPADSDRQEPVDDSALWVLESLSESERTLQADKNLQTRLLERLEANQNMPLSVPKDSSMSKPLELYQQALNDPAVLAWFKSKGFVLDTLIIHEGSVSGTVIHDGVSATQTFSAWDTSGWWQVSAQVLAARKVLDPGNFGLPFVDDDHNLVPCNVIFDFYNVPPPRDDEDAASLATHLKKEGWPEITAQDREDVMQECKAVMSMMTEKTSRTHLIRELNAVSDNLADDAPLSLLGRYTRNINYPSLTDSCADIVEDLNAFMKLPKMKEICKDANLNCDYSPVRICDEKIQVLESSHWKDLTSLVEAQSALSGPFNELLKKVGQTGNALYSTLTIDLQQVIGYMGFGSPKTAGEVRNVIQWLNTTLPSAPPFGDYGGDLLGDARSLIKLTGADRATVISQQKNFFTADSSIIDALGADMLAGTCVEYRRSHVDELLEKMFEQDQSDAWGHELIQALGWNEAGQPVLPGHSQQLLLAAIKLAVDPDTPGRRGTIAGYDVYQPKNLGRDFTTVRTELEQHLIDHRNVSAQAAPLVAHLFLADAAPELLVHDPGKAILIGTAGWMTLRTGVAIAETLCPGCSRAMSADQLIALALLAPATPGQHLLFKSVAVDILMTWGVMNGVVQSRGDAAYSSADYLRVTHRFATQRAQLAQALEGFNQPLVTRKEIAIRELEDYFSFFTKEPIEEIKIEADVFEPLDKFYPVRTIEKTLVEAYMDGDLFFYDWKASSAAMDQAVFKRCVSILPVLNDLLSASVNSVFESRQNAFLTSTKSLIANLPLEDRQCLEWGEVKLFTLREETGKPKEDETPQIQAALRGRQGTILRCEYQQKISYFEVFPGRLSIRKRTDLPDELPLNGVIKIEEAKISKHSTVKVQVMRGTRLPFDFAAYSQGSEPTAGATSPKLIIEQLGSALPAVAGQRREQMTPVPDSYGSNRTATIVDRIINGNYLHGEREFLFKKAKGQTTKEENRAYWEKVGRFVLQLIPFVGCTDDLQSGDRMRLINGAFGCFTDLASALNTLVGGAGRITRLLGAVVPVRTKAFEAIKITGSTIVSLINPLDGLPDLVAGGARVATSFRKILTSGVFALTEAGIGHLQVCLDRLRGFFGGMANGAASRLPRSVTSTMGRVNGTRAMVTRLNDKWYALDSIGNPIGRALDPSVVRQIVVGQEA